MCPQRGRRASRRTWVGPAWPSFWNEIRHRALLFSPEWQGATREQAKEQSFWNAFFDVFRAPRRTVATFEEPVLRMDPERRRSSISFIDLLWSGKLLVEHKRRGTASKQPSRRRLGMCAT